MKRNSIIGVVAVVLSLGIATEGFAFGLPKLPGGNKAASESNAESIDAVLGQQESIVKTYQSSMGSIMTAQALLLEAFGKKEKAAEIMSAREALASGATSKEQFEKAIKLSSSATEDFEQMTRESVPLSSEGRAKYQEALVPYASGVAKAIKLGPEFKNFTKSATAQMKSASFTEKMKVKKKLSVGVYLASKAPGYISSLTSTTGKVLSYGKSQNVSVVSANETLAAVGLTL